MTAGRRLVSGAGGQRWRSGSDLRRAYLLPGRKELSPGGNGLPHKQRGRIVRAGGSFRTKWKGGDAFHPSFS